jgi:hypothetical protein|tara:strand:- start:343 stop:702 length:360 start_codon:yes stop_codon:yes gene_type:complete
MKQTVNFSEFCDRFRDMGRNNNFTYKGKKALFNYLEDYEENQGEEMELDIIGLCCDFTEYENLKEIQGDYPDIKSIEQLEAHTRVIPLVDSNEECPRCRGKILEKLNGGEDGGFIIQVY